MDSAEWSGRLGDVWSQEWQRTDRSFAGVAAALDRAILAAAPERGAVLDIGCGAGSTSIALATARPSLSVTGIDLSADLIAIAAARGAGLPNLRFQVADAADPPPPILGGAHAMAMSRHGVMFFADPVAGFAAIRALLVPGAPFVFSCFQSPARNPWASEVVEAVTGTPPEPAGDPPVRSPSPIRITSAGCCAMRAGTLASAPPSSIAMSPARAPIRLPTPPASSPASAPPHARSPASPRMSAPPRLRGWARCSPGMSRATRSSSPPPPGSGPPAPEETCP